MPSLDSCLSPLEDNSTNDIFSALSMLPPLPFPSDLPASLQHTPRTPDEQRKLIGAILDAALAIGEDDSLFDPPGFPASDQYQHASQ